MRVRVSGPRRGRGPQDAHAPLVGGSFGGGGGCVGRGLRKTHRTGTGSERRWGPGLTSDHGE